MTTPRQRGTNPRAQQTNPRATGSNPRAHQDITRDDITSVHQRISELNSKLDRVIALLERRDDTRPVGATRTADGKIHLPGSQPFGTQTPEHIEDDPIPNAGPATAKQALHDAQKRLP